MFDKFKAAHGGLGPLQALNSAVTGGEGIGGRLGVRHSRSVLNSIIDQQSTDSQLADVMAPVWDQLKRTRMTEADLDKAAAGLVNRAADIKATDSNFADFSELQKRYRGAAVSNDDHAILDSIDTQGKIAHDMLRSNNPQIQEQGRALFGQVFSAQRDFATKNEEQRITAENTIGSQRWTEFSALQDNYRQESQPFLTQRGAYGRIKAALSTPDSAAGDMALIYNYMKVLDPNSTVLPGEYASAQNVTGVPDLVVTAYNQLIRDGQRLTPAQRQDFFKQAGATYSQARGEQAERDSRYLGQARDVGLPDSMLGHFVFPQDSPGDAPADFGHAQIGGPAASAPENDSTPRMVGESVAGGVGTAARGAFDFVAGAAAPVGRFVKSIDETMGQAMGIYPKPPTAEDLTYPKRGTIQRNTDEFR